MKKFLLISTSLYCLSPMAWAAPADWSDLFKSWEKGCDTSPALSAFTESMGAVKTKANGQLTNGQFYLVENYLVANIKLPAQYRNQAAQKASVHKRWDERQKYTFNQIRLSLKGHYYGLPVVDYSQTFIADDTAGSEYTHRLLLDVPIEQAQRVLAGKYRPRKHFNLALEEDETLQAELLDVDNNGKSQTIVECRYIFG
ncbi:hypothetical protein [Wielerella bovis]|uniref:hypothetical protein n=1 Tax=Wielerella bovis TaxID=2917790 RepID=UPI00201A1902|nr:hypothetical protein [Wielerella bovis]MCG7657449.1 hypothetical protein [Wielerella bovis]MCG7659670.1 hypothetical protein [Wielerella bovis]